MRLTRRELLAKVPDEDPETVLRVARALEHEIVEEPRVPKRLLLGDLVEGGGREVVAAGGGLVLLVVAADSEEERDTFAQAVIERYNEKE